MNVGHSLIRRNKRNRAVLTSLLGALVLLLASCGTGTAGKKNLPPEVSFQIADAYDEGTEVTFSVTASDPDGRVASYEWIRFTGPEIGFVESGSSITFVLPEVDADTEFGFIARVRDEDGANTEVILQSVITNVSKTKLAKALANIRNSRISAQFSNDRETANIRFDTKADFEGFNKTAISSGCHSPLSLVGINGNNKDLHCIQLKLDEKSDKHIVLSADLSKYSSSEFKLYLKEFSNISTGKMSDGVELLSLTPKSQGLAISGISASVDWQDNRWFKVTNASNSSLDLADFALRSSATDFVNFDSKGEQNFQLPSLIVKPGESIILQDEKTQLNWSNKFSNLSVVTFKISDEVRPHWNNKVNLALIEKNTQNVQSSIAYVFEKHNFEFSEIKRTRTNSLYSAISDFKYVH